MEYGRTELSKDDRPIRDIFNDYAARFVGQDGITKIVAYDEHGEMDWVPWFAIFKGDEIYERIPAKAWGVTY